MLMNETKGMEKAEFSALFPLSLLVKPDSRSPTSSKVWSKASPPWGMIRLVNMSTDRENTGLWDRWDVPTCAEDTGQYQSNATLEYPWKTTEMIEFSEDWKRTNTTPVLKKSKSEHPGTCRLVSLTSVTEKVMKEDEALSDFSFLLELYS